MCVEVRRASGQNLYCHSANENIPFLSSHCKSTIVAHHLMCFPLILEEAPKVQIGDNIITLSTYTCLFIGRGSISSCCFTSAIPLSHLLILLLFQLMVMSSLITGPRVSKSKDRMASLTRPSSCLIPLALAVHPSCLCTAGHAPSVNTRPLLAFAVKKAFLSKR